MQKRNFSFQKTRGRILGRHCDKIDLKLVCYVSIVPRNLKSENSQDYAQQPPRNYTFMNSASEDSYLCLQFCILCTVHVVVFIFVNVHVYKLRPKV